MISEAVLAVLAGAGVHLLAVISPGPNFFVVSRTALAHSRAAAQWVTVGVTAGAVVIVTTGFLGAAAVFTRSDRLFHGLRLVGAVYLCWLGAKALWSVKRSGSPFAATSPADPPAPIAAFRLGLLTIVTNAKAFVYLVIFFTAVVPPDLPLAARATLVVVMPAITFSWYSFVAWAFSGAAVRRWYARMRVPVEILFGVVLLLIGIEVALTA